MSFDCVTSVRYCAAEREENVREYDRETQMPLPHRSLSLSFFFLPRRVESVLFLAVYSSILAALFYGERETEDDKAAWLS